MTKPFKPSRLFVDQCGNHFYARTVAALREQIPGRCSIMYVDKTDGTRWRTGYVIGDHWLTEFQRVEKPA
jgi:hypothetical protein